MPSYKITRGYLEHTAHIQEGRPFNVPAKSTLLMAAQAAGVDWPYGCRVGVCGRCRCKLLHGSVSQLGDQGRTLGDAAVSDGYILACRSLLESNILVLPPEHAHASAEDVGATITSLDYPTSGIARLRLTLDTPYANAYRAGQYARISVPQAVPPRCFSFATACTGNGDLEFHIRLFPEGKLAEWLRREARPGGRMQVSQPLGDISLDGLSPAHALLFIAGGTGLSPILSMLEEIAAWPEPAQAITLFYAARDRAHLYAAARVDTLKEQLTQRGTQFRFVPVLSREPDESDWQGLRGHLFDHMEKVLPAAQQRHAFLCGPPGLVDAAELSLLRHGLARREITADRFIPAFD